LLNFLVAKYLLVAVVTARIGHGKAIVLLLCFCCYCLSIPSLY